jgi:hypothetical protein
MCLVFKRKDTESNSIIQLETHVQRFMKVHLKYLFLKTNYLFSSYIVSVVGSIQNFSILLLNKKKTNLLYLKGIGDIFWKLS